MKMLHTQIFLVLFLFFAFPATSFSEDKARTDDMGREIIEGPVSGGFYNNVHIISDSVGIDSYSDVTVTNSVIEADICIKTPGRGATIRNNTLKCGVCVEFTGNTIVNNTLINNRCSGRMTNRSDAF